MAMPTRSISSNVIHSATSSSVSSCRAVWGLISSFLDKLIIEKRYVPAAQDESRYFIDYRYIGLDRKVQSPDFSASAIIAAHSASVTGDTDSRDWRIVAMSFSAGVAFIAASVTGRASAATGLTAPETQLPSVRSEEHTSELQSLMRTSYAAFCLKKKKNK